MKSEQKCQYCSYLEMRFSSVSCESPQLSLKAFNIASSADLMLFLLKVETCSRNFLSKISSRCFPARITFFMISKGMYLKMGNVSMRLAAPIDIRKTCTTSTSVSTSLSSSLYSCPKIKEEMQFPKDLNTFSRGQNGFPLYERNFAHNSSMCNKIPAFSSLELIALTAILRNSFHGCE